MIRLIQGVLLLTGALMVAAPKALTRKDDRTDEETVKKTRRMGYWVFFAGVIWVITAFLFR